jgi:ubiquitin-protein ligase
LVVASLELQLTGPTRTPYEGGWFDVELQFASNFPRSLPQAKFTTPIWHPNINESSGRVCIDISRDNGAKCSLAVVLMALQMLLSKPNPDSPLNSAAAVEYKEGDGATFRKKAAEWTRKHAMLH